MPRFGAGAQYMAIPAAASKLSSSRFIIIEQVLKAHYDECRHAFAIVIG